MANHGYVSSKETLSAEKVLADLQEINNRRFNGMLKIKESNWVPVGSWYIFFQDDGWEHPEGFDIWITSPNKLEHRHEHGWAFYLEIVFSYELGKKYGGKISDDCCEEEWEPNPDKYPTFKSWLEARYGRIKTSHPDSYKQLVEIELDTCPIVFRDM